MVDPSFLEMLRVEYASETALWVTFGLEPAVGMVYVKTISVMAGFWAGVRWYARASRRR